MMSLRLCQTAKGQLVYLYNKKFYDATTLKSIKEDIGEFGVLVEKWDDDFTSDPVFVGLDDDFGIFVTGEQMGIVDMFPILDRDDILDSTDQILEIIPFKLPRYYSLPLGSPDSLPPDKNEPFHKLWLTALENGLKNKVGISEIVKPVIKTA
jgi:hypothetical protein